MNKLDVLDFTIYYNDDLYKVTATPYLLPVKNGIPQSFDLLLNGKAMGDLLCLDDKWVNENIDDEGLLEKIGSFINAYYLQNQRTEEIAAG